jgi:hypothetical protein
MGFLATPLKFSFIVGTKVRFFGLHSTKKSGHLLATEMIFAKMMINFLRGPDEFFGVDGNAVFGINHKRAM